MKTKRIFFKLFFTVAITLGVCDFGNAQIGDYIATPELRVENGKIIFSGTSNKMITGVEIIDGSIYNGKEFVARNPNALGASVKLDFNNNIARLRYGGTGVGSTGGFQIVGTGDNVKFSVDHNGNSITPGEVRANSVNALEYRLNGNLISFVGAEIVSTRWTQTPTNPNNTFYNDGYVGIGTNVPEEMLHVTANTRIDGSLFADDGITTRLNITSDKVFTNEYYLNGRLLNLSSLYADIPPSAPPKVFWFENTDNITNASSTGGVPKKVVIGAVGSVESLEVIGNQTINNGNLDVPNGQITIGGVPLTPTWQKLGNGNVITYDAGNVGMDKDLVIGGTIFMVGDNPYQKRINLLGFGNHEYIGFGVDELISLDPEEGTSVEKHNFRYQVANQNDDHVFYSGIDSESSKELMRIKGTGDVLVSGTIDAADIKVNGESISLNSSLWKEIPLANGRKRITNKQAVPSPGFEKDEILLDGKLTIVGDGTSLDFYGSDASVDLAQPIATFFDQKPTEVPPYPGKADFYVPVNIYSTLLVPEGIVTQRIRSDEYYLGNTLIDFGNGVWKTNNSTSTDGIKYEHHVTIGTLDKVPIDGTKLHVDGRVYISEEGGEEKGFTDRNHPNFANTLLWIEKGMTANDISLSRLNNFPDYVFYEDYKLSSLKEIESFIKTNGHLPYMQPAKEYEENGFKISDMTKNIVKTIEEQILHAINQQKEIDELKATVAKLIKQIESQNSDK